MSGILDKWKVTLDGWVRGEHTRSMTEFSDADGTSVTVSADTPLPVQVIGGNLGSGSGQAADTTLLAKESSLAHLRDRADQLALDATLAAVRDAVINLYPLLANTDGVEGLLQGVIDKDEAIRTLLAGVLKISATSLPLPAGAASEATLAAVRTALQAQIDIASSVWTDNSGAYFVRRDLVNEGTSQITVTFTDPSGAAATPGPGLRPLSSAERVVIESMFDALGAGTGYAAGDLLARVAVFNPDTQVSVFLWFNLTQGSTLSTAPAAASIQRADEAITARLSDANGAGITLGKKGAAASLPVTLDSDTPLATQATSAQILTALGPLATQATLAQVLTALAPLTGTLTVNTGLTGLATQATLGQVLTALQGLAAKTDTQPVSAAALPLPAGAATEGTLAALKTAVQAQIDIASTVWTDNTGAYFVRRDLVNEGNGQVTTVFVAPDGSAATTGAGLRPLASANRVVIEAAFDATAAGTGYAAGDLLERVAIYNPDTLVTTFLWFNLTAGAVLGSAPASASIQRADEAVTARLTDANGASVTLGQKAAASSLPVVLAPDQTLPLPAGAATEATLAAQSGKFPASVGQKPGAASFAVVLASDQPTVATRSNFPSATLPGQTLTVDGTVRALTVPSGATYAEIEVTDGYTTNGGNALRWSKSANLTPSATVGRKLAVGDTLTLRGAEMVAFKAIQDNATAATLTVEYGVEA